MAVPVSADGTVRVAEQRELFRRTGALTALNAWYYTPWDVAADGRFIMTRSIASDDSLGATLVVIEHWLDEVRALVRP
jgi:hypothetical protein